MIKRIKRGVFGCLKLIVASSKFLNFSIFYSHRFECYLHQMKADKSAIDTAAWWICEMWWILCWAIVLLPSLWCGAVSRLLDYCCCCCEDSELFLGLVQFKSIFVFVRNRWFCFHFFHQFYALDFIQCLMRERKRKRLYINYEVKSWH